MNENQHANKFHAQYWSHEYKINVQVLRWEKSTDSNIYEEEIKL